MNSDIVLVLVTTLVLVGAFVPGSTVASHGDDSTDFRVTPDNRDTEANDVQYTHEAELTDNFGDGRSGIKEPTSIEFSTYGANVGNCSAAVGVTPGSYTLRIDDQELNPDEESFKGDTASFGIEDPQEDYRVGETLVLELEDCVTNPSSEGWYQTDLVVEGKAFGSDEQVRLEATSHYFAICDDCENDSDARSELGPPPSETPTPTATPTATPTPTAAPTPTPTPAPTPTAAVDDPTPEPGDDPTPTPEPGDDPTPTATETPEPESTETPQDQGTVLGVDPIVVVGVVAAVSIGIAVFGATRL